MQPRKAPCCRDFYSANKQADLRALGGHRNRDLCCPLVGGGRRLRQGSGGDAGGSPNHQGPLRSHQSQGHSNTRKEDLEGGSAGDAGSVCELCCVSITVHEDQLPTGFPPPPSCKPRQVHGEGESPDRCGKHCRPPVLENQTKPGPKCFPESARGRQSRCPRSLARHRGTGKSH